MPMSHSFLMIRYPVFAGGSAAGIGSTELSFLDFQDLPVNEPNTSPARGTFTQVTLVRYFYLHIDACFQSHVTFFSI